MLSLCVAVLLCVYLYKCCVPAVQTNILLGQTLNLCYEAELVKHLVGTFQLNCNAIVPLFHLNGGNMENKCSIETAQEGFCIVIFCMGNKY